MKDSWITDWPPSARWPHYTRANAGEVLPTLASPLGQQVTWERGICLGWRDGYTRMGYFTPDEWDECLPEVCGFFGGYFYINLSNVRMQGVRSPMLSIEQLDLAFFGDHPDVPPFEQHPDDEKPELVPKILEHLEWVTTTTHWPKIDEEREQTKRLRADRPDLRSLSDAELVAYARRTQPLLQQLFDSHTVTSSSSAVAPGILFAVGEAIGDPTIPMKLVAGIGEVDSAEPNYALWDLSRKVRTSEELTRTFDEGVPGVLDRLRASPSSEPADFLRDFERFLVDFGSRGPNEWEISAHTWETKPEIVLAALDRVRLQTDDESPHVRNRRRAEERQALTQEVRAKAADVSDDLAGQVDAAVTAANQLAFRERTKTNIIRVVHEGRMAFRELGRRHAEAGDLEDAAHVFMLLDEEVERFVERPASFTSVLAGRYREWQALSQLQPPFFIKNGTVPPLSAWRKRAGESEAVKAAPGEVLHGVPGCPGVVRGRARVVLDASEPSGLEPGEILIAPLTDPAWTPLFMAAGGVVVDVGGQISHSIIVSRELGLPCVVSVTDATVRIPDGALVEVNGDTGQVRVIEVSAA